ncbi:G2/mitotic-specific cyclin cig2-like [Aphidius gifuensis]|nr:G2/mitotic-specific cyclin cig2-like [Aphidius gifuensis]
MHSYSSSTLYIAVRIFEDVVRIVKDTVDNLQLIALAAMWIAIKRDSITYIIPTAQKVADYSNGVFTNEDVIKCEAEILSAIKFDLAYADPSFIMSYCLVSNTSSLIASDEKIARAYYFGSYMIDLALLDDQLMSISPILLATTVGEIAIGLVMQPEKYLSLIHFEQWRTDIARNSFKDSDIFKVRSKIVRCIVASCTDKSYSRTIYKKYKRTRYGAISDDFLKKVSMLV